MGEAASPSQLLRARLLHGAGGWSRTLASGAALGTLSSLRPSSDGGAPSVSYHLPPRAGLAGSTLGIHHLIPPLPKHKPSSQRQETEAETAGLGVFISMPKPAQTWQKAAPEGKEGRQWQTKPGHVPGRQPGPGQQEAQSRGRKGVGQGGKSWRHQGVPRAGGTEKERQRGQLAGQHRATTAR